MLQEKLREKSDGFDELVIKKELADRQVLIQEQEIKRLQETNASCRREATELREELEKQRNTVKALRQVAALVAWRLCGVSVGAVGRAPSTCAAVPAPCREDGGLADP